MLQGRLAQAIPPNRPSGMPTAPPYVLHIFCAPREASLALVSHLDLLCKSAAHKLFDLMTARHCQILAGMSVL